MNIRKLAYSLAIVMLSYRINRMGYGACGGLEKIVEKTEKLKSC